MKKVLLTGSNGQLGRALRKELANDKKIELILTDILHEDHENNNTIINLDISNRDNVDSIIKEYKPEIIINCAAMTAVDLCETQTQLAFNINALGVKYLAEAAKLYKSMLFQISTDYVFDGENDIPYIESDKPTPRSVYGETKLQGEKYASEINDRTYIMRTAWLYGEGKNFVETMLMLSDKGSDIRVVEDQFGSPTSAIELARAIVYIIGSKESHYGVYHATAEGETSWYGFAKEIFKISNKETKVKPITTSEYPTPARRPRYSVLENKALLENYNYKMKDWKEGLREYFKDVKLH
ncbi:MAG TPA: dTDP-4-dehydrorhamnose reductase [Clostridiales bacterium]|nr:dTDP-4-dehydrorhamnose reductase [Clostridiales bacterium]